MPMRELVVAGGTQETAPQHCGWRSIEVVDQSQIFMATWEIADAVDLVPDARKVFQRALSSEPPRAA